VVDDGRSVADPDVAAGEALTLDLEEFLRILPHLDSADLLPISATYEQADAAVRDAARAAGSTAANRHGLIDELGRVQSSIIQWAGSDISRSSAFTLEGLQTNPMLGDIRVQAIPPLLDAATALLLKGALSAEQREVLLEPLGAAIG
jgi:hypothetical protein